MRSQRANVRQLQQGGAEQSEVLAAKSRYLNTLHQYQAFSKAMEIPEQMERVYMDGLGRVAPAKITCKSVLRTSQINTRKSCRR